MDRFDHLFATLIERWTMYLDAPRDPHRVIELAAARAALDDARNDVAAARRGRSAPARTGRPPERIAVDADDLRRLRVQGALQA